MNCKRIFLLRSFARLSPFFAAMAFVFAAAIPCPVLGESTAPSGATTKRQVAEAQFEKAEAQRQSLESEPSNRRSLAEYREVVSSYRRVYLITPHSSSVPDALLAVGELYAEMGDHFGRTYYQSSVDAYKFLLHEYPTNKYREEVTLRIAKLQSDQLGQSSAAYDTYQDFLKRYPHSGHRREAQEALAEVALLIRAGAGATPGPAAKNTSAEDDSGDDGAAGSMDVQALPRDGAIPRVRRISTSANANSTRVTIDLEDTVQYRSARIKNPDRIFFDLDSARLTPELMRGNIPVEGDLVKNIRVAQNKSGVVRVVLDVHGVKDYTASLLNDPTRLVIDLYGSEKALREVRKRAGDLGKQPTSASASSDAAGKSHISNGDLSASRRPGLAKPVSAPQPTRDGDSTLTRTLGLKISRIVIDPGHGGHDTGTIGPSGLEEKDLCLDVALRLGRIIQQKLPGAEVIYTRSDDTFVPLEERTRIANEAKADLFISIHANSSHDRQARGIETYYLNLKGSPDSMEVAARENATSQDGIHDLQDIVLRIARTEKIDESREFAEDVQDALSKRILKSLQTPKNRGVRKAPFVVLIGADMPSILTEISFLSNPYDERQMKRPEQRQSIAEGIYQGVATYLQSLNSVTVNLSPNPVPRRTAGGAPVEQSRDQN